ncbi:DUF31 family putative serine protease [Ureaplasma canigenitalium]|uniref:DUF31 family putative serine protease n=1 Tax=Ureaplasma canigenitalium TaxID=42092 RepID=UPI0004E25F59|nr:hypothetical protein [Ureaplasma canigenitalium]
MAKKSKAIFLSTLGLLTTGVVALGVSGCFFLRPFQEQPAPIAPVPNPGSGNTNSILKLPNAGLLHSHSQVDKNTSSLNKKAISLKFTIPLNNTNGISIFGTGWIFDFSLNNPNMDYDQATIDDVKTFYIATNIHVINAVSSARQNVELSLGSININDKNHDPRLTASYGNNRINRFTRTQANASNRETSILDEWFLADKTPGTFAIAPVGIKDYASKFYSDNLAKIRAQRGLTNLTNASDLAIIKIRPTDAQKKAIRAFREFDPQKGVSFGDAYNNELVEERTIFLSGGYPSLGRGNPQDSIPRYRQYKSYYSNYTSSFGAQENYRADNPIVFNYRSKLLNQNNIKDVGKGDNGRDRFTTGVFPYHSYDVPIEGFDLGPGASGSPVIDKNNNIIGIYWGGFNLINKRSIFYGNFTPIFWSSSNKKDLSQDLLKNYLAFTANDLTFLDRNYTTSILEENISPKNKEIYLKYLADLKNEKYQRNKVVDKIYAYRKDSDFINEGSNADFNDLITTFYQFIKKLIDTETLNKTHGQLPPPDDIKGIEISWDERKNIAIKVSFIFDKEINFGTVGSFRINFLVLK